MIPVTKITKVVEFVKFSSKAIIVTVVVFYIIDSGVGQKLGLCVVNRVLNAAQTIIKNLKGDEKYITIEIPQILDNENLPLAIRIPTSGKVTKVTHVFSTTLNLLKPILSLLPLLTHLFDSDSSDLDEGLIRSIIRESKRL